MGGYPMQTFSAFVAALPSAVKAIKPVEDHELMRCFWPRKEPTKGSAPKDNEAAGCI